MTPTHYVETRADPKRTHVVLRAWMIWRARQEGWNKPEHRRDRWFADEATRLEGDVKRFQPQADGILGNVPATAQFISWVPDIAARVRA